MMIRRVPAVVQRTGPLPMRGEARFE